MRARIAVHESWANTSDRSERTRKARENSPQSLAYWEREVDPEGVLPELERHLRAEAKFRAHMTRLSYKRSLKKSAKTKQTRNATKAGRVDRPSPDHTRAPDDDRHGS
jgi:hypothetical protein